MPQRLVSGTGAVVADRVDRARTFGERGRGLLGRPPLGAGEALVIERAKQVHTFGMRYAIDVCFCDGSGEVLHVVRDMHPRRLSKLVLRSRFVVEMPGGAMADVRPGDQLSLVELNDR